MALKIRGTQGTSSGKMDVYPWISQWTWGTSASKAAYSAGGGRIGDFAAQ